jgi:hypothetical protein
MARHNISEQGRLRCAESGYANLRRWQNGEVPAGALEIEREIEAIRAQLEERATLRAEPARGLLIRSAVVQFTKIRLIERRLLRTAQLSAKAPLGADDLAPLSSGFLRTLRALGVVDEDASVEDDQTPAEWLVSQARSAGGGS